MQEVIDVRDGTHDSPQYVSNGYPFVTSKNLINGKMSFENIKYIGEKDFQKYNERSKVDENDILMAMIGSIGKPVLVTNKDREFSIKNVALLKHIPGSGINMKYVLHLMNYAEANMKSQATGGVQQFVSLNYLRSYPFPLPPIEEQGRIVARVDELMAKIDEYEKIEKDLTELQKKFPGDMKDAILQAAMQGKLTGFDWNEDDNPEIYKPLWSVTAWDKKFKAVEKRKQSKVMDYHYYLAAEMRTIEDNTGDVFLLSTGDYQGWTTEEKTQGNFREGEIVSIPWGGSPNVKYFKGKFITSDNRIATALNTDELSNRFLYYYMLSKVGYLDTIYRGTGLRHPDMAAVLDMMIPLPPIEEQQRIVDKLDQLLPLCESLEAME
jgi:type I restriction enzyme S subunit